MHGIGEARARAPPSQHNDHISLLEEASGLANIHGQIHMEVYILRPGVSTASLNITRKMEFIALFNSSIPQFSFSPCCLDLAEIHLCL